MRIILILPFLVFMSLTLKGQKPVGEWSDHLGYNTASCLAVSRDEIFASNGSSILIYNLEFAELKTLSRINGLSETGISTIGWSEENKALIIAYSNTNVDIMYNNIIYNIPDINREYIPGKKVINKIRSSGKYAYLACSFGIVVIDIIKKEVFDTWKPGISSENNEVWDIAFGNNKIFAATEIGIYSADINDQGLPYYGNWHINNLLPDPTARYTSIIFTGNKLYANLSDPLHDGDRVYSIENSCSLFLYTNDVFNNSLDSNEAGFTVSSGSTVKYYSPGGSIIKTISSYGWAEPDIAQAIVKNGNIWIADIKSGLVSGKNMSEFYSLSVPGPVSNNAFSISSFYGKTIICGGGTDPSWNNLGRPVQISISDNNQWASLTSITILDPVRSIVDPKDINHIFVSTWGGGLLEYDNINLIKQYNEANSPLQTIVPGQSSVRICGLAFDKLNNLWITQSEGKGSIKVLKPDGRWIVNPLTIDAPILGDILITSSEQKWIILPLGYGLFVLDDNKTPDIFSDDRFKRFALRNTDNQLISHIYSIVEDLDGNIWIGTDQGPLIYNNPERVFETDLKASHIKIPRNDGTDFADYMLKSETITSIAVDGSNRKWIGTSGSGAYLLSPDGITQIRNYNEQNSPLLSNSITSLAVDNKSGEVWFGTAKGIQSVRGDATTGEEKFQNVFTFPNPVRQDFSGNVTITGLLRNTQIKITDISGNLVYETVSDGGQASWNLNNFSGERVATGVYLVFCASKDGSQSHVTKMLVIK